MAEDKPMGVGFDITEYWQVKALSVEWLYVLSTLALSVNAAPEEQHCVMGVSWDSTPLYLLKKRFYPAAEISRVTGIAEEKLSSYKGVITLQSVANDLPEPNVPYWGKA